MSPISKEIVNYLTILEEESGQRLDNYLIKILKGVPKSHIYRIIRSGEVRINKARVKSDSRVQANDVIRIPPIRIAEKSTSTIIPSQDFAIVYEDATLLVINKPSGVAVHGGSGLSYGVIEQLRQARPEARYLELVHRLDKDTSGLLMIAKKRSSLVKLHEQFRQNHPQKVYLALSVGAWPENSKNIKLPLFKYTGAQGEKMVRVDEKGQYAHTVFKVLERFKAFSLVEATIKTGRTHQIRVHMQSQSCPIAGDERYGDYELNKKLAKQGLKRMFLHAYQLKFIHPISGEVLELIADLPKELQKFLESLRNEA